MKNYIFLFFCLITFPAFTQNGWDLTNASGTNSISGTIYRNGGIGLGVSNPSSALHISTGNNDINFFKNIPSTNNLIGTLQSSSNLGIQAEVAFRYFKSNPPIGNDELEIMGSDEGTSIEFWNFRKSSLDNTNFSTTYTKSMEIDHKGNIGIGRESSNYRLDVNGTAHFSSKVSIGSNIFPMLTNEQGQPYKLAVEGGIVTQEVTVELSIGNWPDYVFETHYNLMSLPTLKKYLTTNKHLPNMPSAKQLEAKGMELKSMTICQQQNIEEIYLHLIQLNERLETLEKENKFLKEKLDDEKSN